MPAEIHLMMSNVRTYQVENLRCHVMWTSELGAPKFAGKLVVILPLVFAAAGNISVSMVLDADGAAT